jgi:hypothetical protein
MSALSDSEVEILVAFCHYCAVLEGHLARFFDCLPSDLQIIDRAVNASFG